MRGQPTIRTPCADITLPVPASIEVAPNAVILEWHELDYSEYAPILPCAATALEQVRTRTGRFIVLHSGGRVATLIIPWYEPYRGVYTTREFRGVYRVSESMSRERIVVRIEFFIADEAYREGV